MDRVRFGRALGYGARHAAKSLLEAAEAASTPNASPTTPLASTSAPAGSKSASETREASPQASTQRMPNPPGTQTSPVQHILRGAAQVRTAQRQAGKQARHSFFGPLAKFSSVVSLQVTGTFFALLALIMAQAAWRSRAAWHWGASAGSSLSAGSPDPRRFYIVAGVGLLFAYFAVSNFVRANRRDRR